MVRLAYNWGGTNKGEGGVGYNLQFTPAKFMFLTSCHNLLSCSTLLASLNFPRIDLTKSQLSG